MQDWLTHRVRATPNRTALVRASTGETLDFEGLDAMVDDLAGRLAALGVETGDHLGMVMETGLAAVCTVHAADRLGAVFVPLGDGLTAVELAAQLDTADVTTLVCSAETEATAVDAFDGPICSVDDPTHEAVASLADASPASITPATWSVDDTRLLLFTSGTTGSPKAVRLTQGNLLWSAIASAFRLGLHSTDRWLVCLSLHHMGGLSPVLRMPLYGMTVVLEDSFDPGRTADDIGSHDVTCVSLVPTMLKRMLNLRGTLADSLRVILLGGAPAADDLIRRCRDFSVPVHPTYGMTETASQVATAVPKEAFADIGTVGRPLFCTSVTIRDDDGTELDAGETGELVVDGPTVSPGYYGNPEATSAAFGPHGLRTGDVGYRDDRGKLFVQGRVDDQIITGGENVHPQEVTAVLRSHPMVDEAAVVGVPDRDWGELVGALIVPSDDELTADALEAYCRERLAGFKLPRVIAFVEALPLTESGTVERAAARARLVEGITQSAAENGRDIEDDLAKESPAQPTESDAETGPESGDESEDGGRDTEGDTDRPAVTSTEGTERGSDVDDGETYLIGGSDWSPGEPTTTDDEPDSTGDREESTLTDELASTPTETETPDFVREVLPDEPAENGDEEREDTENGGLAAATAERDDDTDAARDDADERAETDDEEEEDSDGDDAR